MGNALDTIFSTLKQKVNNLALAIVLAGSNTPSSVQNHLHDLKEIKQLASKLNQKEIGREAELAEQALVELKGQTSDPKNCLKTLGAIFERMEDALDCDLSEPDVSNEPRKQSQPSPEGRPDPTSCQGGIRHPDALPSYLSEEDFKEFLISKMPVLETFETLILDFENGDMEEAPKEMKRILHTIKGESGFLSLKDVEKVCHRTEDVLVNDLRPEFAEILLRVKDWFQATFAFYSGEPSTAEPVQTVLALLATYEACDPVEEPSEPAPAVPKPGGQQEVFKSDELRPRIDGVKRPVQVDSDRLDNLIDIIGELAIAEAMVSRGITHGGLDPKSMENALKALGKSTKSLQKIGLSLRMVPLTPLFNRMNRVARDLAKKQNKPVDFIIRGESTQLDKNLVDALADPLIHIIRNSIDHGIETDTQERSRAGKPETATITLEGFHKGGSLQIEICDDGQGIDRNKLLEKARARGLVDDATTLDNQELLNLIFHSGLSTANRITDISGRGIGMDVVRKSIHALNGRISLESEQGKGTTVSIKLPLTLSIMDGMVVRAGQNKYVIPTLSIVSSIHYSKEITSSAMGKDQFFRFQGQFIPLLNLDEVFADITPENNRTLFAPPAPVAENGMKINGKKNNTVIVVVEDASLKAGLIIDELISKQSVVRKPLTDIIKIVSNLPAISGGTILADGRVCLILDIPVLVALAHGKAGKLKVTPE